jgi:hypothetical protein
MAPFTSEESAERTSNTVANSTGLPAASRTWPETTAVGSVCACTVNVSRLTSRSKPRLNRNWRVDTRTVRLGIVEEDCIVVVFDVYWRCKVGGIAGAYQSHKDVKRARIQAKRTMLYRMDW